MKIRQFLTLEEQISYLEQNKNIRFDDKEEAKKFLRDNNYFNLISCSKVKFASGVEEGRHLYPETNFSDWILYFQQDCKVSGYLMQNVISIERVLNSRLSIYISEVLHEGILSKYKQNEIQKLIERGKNNSDFQNEMAWRYIPQLTFGEMKHLLIWIHDYLPEIYMQVTDGFSWLQTNNRQTNIDRLHELNHLRNDLFHGCPLNIYLTYGRDKTKRRQYRVKVRVVNNVLDFNRCHEIRGLLRLFHDSAKKFIKIKNSQT